MVYINILTHRCYPSESRMYAENYQALNSAGNDYNCTHMYASLLTFCITLIIYYIIRNAAYAFIKSTYITIVYTKVLSTCNIDKICLWHILIPKAFEVSSSVPIKV